LLSQGETADLADISRTSRFRTEVRSLGTKVHSTLVKEYVFLPVNY
jgi:hypothetical protein